MVQLAYTNDKAAQWSNDESGTVTGRIDTSNRGVDPPTIEDSSTQQISSFESSNKGNTFESATCDDTIPSKPVIIPDFPSKSEDNYFSTSAGVEVSGAMSECLSIITTEPDSLLRNEEVGAARDQF